MHTLEKLLAKRIASGLQRKTIAGCADWATKHRIMGQPFPGHYNFKYHPWCREIHDCKDEVIVSQKGAQLGLTETALNKVFYAIDIEGRSVLYMLPNSKPDCADFSASRFDPALELSPHLEELFTEVKNVGHKRAGSASLYIRGSKSRSQVKGIPVGLIIFDELDEMNKDNVVLAAERTSGQKIWQHFYLSTPTVDDCGINLYFQDSTQDNFYFPCPHCGKHIQLVFPTSLVITADDPNSADLKNTHLICSECKQILEHEAKPDFLAKGRFVKTYPDAPYRGFHINQLYSSTVEPWQLARSWLRAQLNPTDEQEFYNSKLGLTHVVEGAQVTDEDIEACTSNYVKSLHAPHNDLITMGVDVGKQLHIEITQWKRTNDDPDPNLAHMGKLLYEGKVVDFEDLDSLMHQFRVRYCVIDAQPERRKALEFAQRFSGHVSICFYAEGIRSKEINESQVQNYLISVDRTSWLDQSLGRLRRRAMVLPQNLSLEYKEHMKVLTRIYTKDRYDNPIGRYVKGSKADHFAHARNYCELALYFATSIRENKPLTTPVW